MANVPNSKSETGADLIMAIVKEFQHGYCQYKVTIVPKVAINIKTTYDDGKVTSFTYNMGEMAEYDSYNLSYYGPIKSITENTVTIEAIGGKNRRLKIVDFAWRNSESIQSKKAKNSETMLYI